MKTILLFISLGLLFGCGDDSSKEKSSNTSSSQAESNPDYTYMSCQDAGDCIGRCYTDASENDVDCHSACVEATEPTAGRIFDGYLGCVIDNCDGDFGQSSCVIRFCDAWDNACAAYTGPGSPDLSPTPTGDVQQLTCSQVADCAVNCGDDGACVDDCWSKGSPTAIDKLDAYADCYDGCSDDGCCTQEAQACLDDR